MNIPLLFYITLFIDCIVAVWVIFRWKYSTIQQRLISLLLAASASAEVIELCMTLYHIRNLWISQIFTLIEYVLVLSTCYLWKSRKTDKHILIIFVIAFTILWIVSKFTFEPFYLGDTYTSSVSKIIQIIVAASVLFDVLQDTNVELKTDARLWISSGVIIYSSGTLFLFALFNMMLDASPELIRTLWPINWILMIVFTLLLARGVWCKAAQ